MSNSDYKPNPKNMSDEELKTTLGHMEIDPDKFKEDISAIMQELNARKSN